MRIKILNYSFLAHVVQFLTLSGHCLKRGFEWIGFKICSIVASDRLDYSAQPEFDSFLFRNLVRLFSLLFLCCSNLLLLWKTLIPVFEFLLKEFCVQLLFKMLLCCVSFSLLSATWMHFVVSLFPQSTIEVNRWFCFICLLQKNVSLCAIMLVLTKMHYRFQASSFFFLSGCLD